MSSHSTRLERARALRSIIASDLRDVREGHISARAALIDPSGALKYVPIHRVVLAIPGVGEVAMKNAIQTASVWPLDKLGDVHPDLRDVILWALPDRVRD